MDRPSVLLIVWDACRLDTARSVTPNLRDLAEENLWFENAIAPAGSSLPSHVSMFTGQYPHEHGTYEQTHQIESTPLLDRLGEAGYVRYGVSANGFASAKYGFDEGFDRFYNTQGVTVYPDGLDVHGYARTLREEGDGSLSAGDVEHWRLFETVARHDHPLKSAVNVGAAGVSQLVMRYPILSRIPHRRFNRYNEFAYDPKQNTEWLTDLFQTASTGERPFFAFTNYMDPHHPYAPPRRYQREHCGRTFDYRELDQLAQVTHPLEFIKRCTAGDPPSEETLETVRSLYAGEVRTADEHLGSLLEALERCGLREETVVVVTADHGENLGETNEMGETRIGHVYSAGDAHLRVPLVVAHPEIEARRVETPVSLKDLAGLFTSGLNGLLETEGRDIGPLEPPDGVVASEVPATTALLEDRHPELRDVLRRHLSVAYTEDWKVVFGSDDETYAWFRGEEFALEEAPAEVVETAATNLEKLGRQNGEERELNSVDVAHLEALGYI